MSTLQRQTRPPAPVVVASPVRTLTVRWRVARRGLRRHPEVAAWGERGPALVLEVSCAFTPQGRCAGAAARVRDGEREWNLALPCPLRPGRMLADPQRGLEHADVPGVLVATFRGLRTGAIDVLYSRTPLLDVLAVPGGCAEPGGGTVALPSTDS